MSYTPDIYCSYCFSGYHEASGCPVKKAETERGSKVPYPQFCRLLPECFGRGSCPREYACID